jgi:hypothetical protein
MSKLDVGDIARLTVRWSPKDAAGAAAPDTSVLAEQTVTVQAEGAIAEVFTSATTPAITKLDADYYQLLYPITQSGTHQVRWVSTPTVAAAEQTQFKVQAQNTP